MFHNILASTMESSKLTMIPIVFILLNLLNGVTSTGSEGKCEQLTVDMCMDFGYNKTYLPNAVGQTSQDESSSTLFPLSMVLNMITIETCKMHLRRLLCFVYAPECVTIRTTEPNGTLTTRLGPAVPCMSYCQHVSSLCLQELVVVGGITDLINCDNFPSTGCQDPVNGDVQVQGVVDNSTNTGVTAGDNDESEEDGRSTTEMVPTGDDAINTTETALLDSSQDSSDDQGDNGHHSGSCERISVPICSSSIGYNYTLFPNARGHLNQQEAAAEIQALSLSPLIRVGCSPFMAPLVCSLYTPYCDPGSPGRVPPCRSLCDRVMAGCRSLLQMFGFFDSLRSLANCNALPADGDEKCLSYTEDLKLTIIEADPKTRNSGGGSNESTTTDVGNATDSGPTVPGEEDLNSREVEAGQPADEPPEGCVVLNVSDCDGVPYSYTKMPNLIGHESFEHAIEDFELQYTDILHIQCSSVTKQFVCGLYFPPCTEKHETVAPCRHICEDVRRGCEPLLRLVGYSWPAEADCDLFPENAPCLNASGIVTRPDLNPAPAGVAGSPLIPTMTSNTEENITSTTFPTIDIDMLQCFYRGQSYFQGSDFPEGDGCNTCTCGEGGTVMCTEMACQPAGPDYQCIYGDLKLLANETYLLETINSCNICTCEGQGWVTCEPTDCPRNDTSTNGTSTKSDNVTSTANNETVPTTSGPSTVTNLTVLPNNDTSTKSYNVTKPETNATNTEPQKCLYNGNVYDQGSSFPSSDGCNTCTCHAADAISCTERACSKYSCQHGTKLLVANETFILRNLFSCENCTCLQDGLVTCVLVPCSVAPATCMHNGAEYSHAEFRNLDDGCTTCTCTDSSDWLCSSDACSTTASTTPPQEKGGDPSAAANTYGAVHVFGICILVLCRILMC